MYQKFFGLKEKPFNMTPDPEYMFFTNQHREAFAHLVYGIRERRGFIEITGEVGTGKTTLCRAILNEFDENTRIALILNSMLSDIELLRTIDDELFIEAKGDTKKELLDALNAYLIEQHSAGKNVVLLIDEAQNLSKETLEQIRIISNLETVKAKLIQIVLVGQPELREALARKELRQLNQRITVRYHLSQLNAKETEKYIAHRLRVAGSKGKLRFTKGALREIHRFSKGVPRQINTICDQSLLTAYVKETTEIDRDMVKQARKEIEGLGVKASRKRVLLRRVLVPSAVALAVGVALASAALFFAKDRSTWIDRYVVQPLGRIASAGTALLSDSEPTEPPLAPSLAKGAEGTTPDATAPSEAKDEAAPADEQPVTDEVFAEEETEPAVWQPEPYEPVVTADESVTAAEPAADEPGVDEVALAEPVERPVDEADSAESVEPSVGEPAEAPGPIIEEPEVGELVEVSDEVPAAPEPPAAFAEDETEAAEPVTVAMLPQTAYDLPEVRPLFSDAVEDAVEEPVEAGVASGTEAESAAELDPSESVGSLWAAMMAEYSEPEPETRTTTMSGTESLRAQEQYGEGELDAGGVLHTTDPARNTVAGLLSLAYRWRPEEYPVYRAYRGIVNGETTMADALLGMGLDVRQLRLTLDRMCRIDLPTAIEIRRTPGAEPVVGVVLEADPEAVVVSIPSEQQTTLSRAELEDAWSGRAWVCIPAGETEDTVIGAETTGATIRLLEWRLSRLGLFTRTPDDQFDDRTEAALRAFQQKYGLEADGLAGSETQVWLFALTSESDIPSLNSQLASGKP